jgi:[ribosomal protein S18]-alanine N-acetyltransferase
MHSLREARPEDFDQLWRIDQECFIPGIAYSRAELRWYMRRSRAFTLVAKHVAKDAAKDAAKDINHIAAFIVAESDRSGAGHILTLDVLPASRRAKVGSRLLDAAEKRLIKEGCHAVLLETSVDNSAAISFYKRHGYAILETILRYYMDSIDALVMGKRLRHQS